MVCNPATGSAFACGANNAKNATGANISQRVLRTSGFRLPFGSRVAFSNPSKIRNIVRVCRVGCKRVAHTVFFIPKCIVATMVGFKNVFSFVHNSYNSAENAMLQEALLISNVPDEPDVPLASVVFLMFAAFTVGR